MCAPSPPALGHLQFIVCDEAGGCRAVAGVDWQFNAWGGEEGGLYASWDEDQAVAGTILQVAASWAAWGSMFRWDGCMAPPAAARPASWGPAAAIGLLVCSHTVVLLPACTASCPAVQREGVQRFPCPIVMEGGSIHVDGEGTLLTTGGAGEDAAQQQPAC